MDDTVRVSSKTVRVLVAEDSPTQAQRLRYLLEQNGFEVAVGANGRLALELAPSFMVMIRGPALIIETANEACRRLTGYRELIGLLVRQAFP